MAITPVPEAPAGSTYAAVKAELDKLGVSATIPGVAALAAAAGIDDGAVGAARAALLKEMRAAATEAAKIAPPQASRIDELRRKRAERAG